MADITMIFLWAHMTMLFSQRYLRPLSNKTLVVDVPEAARRKVWAWLIANNSGFRIQRDPNDDWTDYTNVLDEVGSDLMQEYAWDAIPASPKRETEGDYAALKDLLLNQPAEYLFDAVQVTGRYLNNSEVEAMRQKVNEIFDTHDCLWRIQDGEFFKLDGDFMGTRLALIAHDALSANRFEGAAQEYAKARESLSIGEIRDAIAYAGHSFESVLKVITGVDGNADKLIKEFCTQGYIDDLPPSLRSGFAEQILKTLPALRNRYGGHGQGATVVSMPRIYGDLAIQLAGAFHNFLIAKYLERKPVPVETPKPTVSSFGPDDEVPF